MADGDAPHLLVARGADELDHPGGTLGAHLRRVADRLAAHRVDELACVAGRYHAAYGTDGFPRPLLGPDERHLLADEIGGAAEAEVWRYCGCDRGATYPGLGEPVVPWFDRFSGTAGEVPRDQLRTFAAVTVANELDVVDHLDMDAGRRAHLRRLLDPLRDLLTPAARVDLDRTLPPPARR